MPNHISSQFSLSHLEQPTPGQFMLESAKAAEGIGRNFMQGMRLGEDKRQHKEQMELARARFQMEKEQNELENQAAQLEIKNQRLFNIDRNNFNTAVNAPEYQSLSYGRQRNFLDGLRSRMVTREGKSLVEERLDYMANTETGRAVNAANQARNSYILGLINDPDANPDLVNKAVILLEDPEKASELNNISQQLNTGIQAARKQREKEKHSRDLEKAGKSPTGLEARLTERQKSIMEHVQSMEASLQRQVGMDYSGINTRMTELFGPDWRKLRDGDFSGVIRAPLVDEPAAAAPAVVPRARIRVTEKGPARFVAPQSVP